MTKQYDTSEPILILVRRGRNNRGFSVSPVEDISNAALCSNETEIGEVILEMLNDPNQPRVNINDLLSASPSGSGGAETMEIKDKTSSQDKEDEPDEDEDDSFQGSGDIADRILLLGLTSILDKGRQMSSSRVRTSTSSHGKKKKK